MKSWTAKLKTIGNLALGFLWVSFIVIAFLAIVLGFFLGWSDEPSSGDPGDVIWCEFENWC